MDHTLICDINKTKLKMLDFKTIDEIEEFYHELQSEIENKIDLIDENIRLEKLKKSQINPYENLDKESNLQEVIRYWDKSFALKKYFIAKIHREVGINKIPNHVYSKFDKFDFDYDSVTNFVNDLINDYYKFEYYLWLQIEYRLDKCLDWSNNLTHLYIENGKYKRVCKLIDREIDNLSLKLYNNNSSDALHQNVLIDKQETTNIDSSNMKIEELIFEIPNKAVGSEIIDNKPSKSKNLLADAYKKYFYSIGHENMMHGLKPPYKKKHFHFVAQYMIENSLIDVKNITELYERIIAKVDVKISTLKGNSTNIKSLDITDLQSISKVLIEHIKI